MRLSPQDEKVVSWAVQTLKESPPPALPGGFLERFEESLISEEEPAKVIVVSRRPHWSRSLVAAAAMMAALLGLLWTSPRPQGAELLLVSASEDARLGVSELTGVTEILVDQVLATGPEGEVTLLAGSPGNQIVLAPESQLVVKEAALALNRTVAELGLDRGTVLVAETSARISVRTPQALIIPIGTNYQVSRDDTSTTVTVMEGAVRVLAPDGAGSVLLSPAHRLTVEEGTRWNQLKPRRLSAAQLDSLRKVVEDRPPMKVRPKLGETLRDYPLARTRKVEPPVRPSVKRKASLHSRPSARPKRDVPRAKRAAGVNRRTPRAKVRTRVDGPRRRSTVPVAPRRAAKIKNQTSPALRPRSHRVRAPKKRDLKAPRGYPRRGRLKDAAPKPRNKSISKPTQKFPRARVRDRRPARRSGADFTPNRRRSDRWAAKKDQGRMQGRTPGGKRRPGRRVRGRGRR